MSTPLPARTLSDADLADACATDLRDAFADYNARFRSITQRAKRRFERREWTAARLDAIERIELYDVCVAETSRRLESELGGRVGDRGLWSLVRDRYAALIAPMVDQELNKTFFNTLTRRFFKTRGVDAAIEFVALDIEPTDRLTHPVPRLTYSATISPAELGQRVLAGFRFEVPYADLAGCGARIAQAIAAQLPRWEGEPKLRAVEMLQTVFYRERRAYLVGRVFGEREFAPLVIALVHEDGGLRADAVMVQRDDVSALFGITRSYFQADLETVGDAVVFLRTLLPKKPVNEIYTVLGRAKQGKTERYRHFYRHFEACDEQLTLADGEKGLVMAVFNLPSYPLVFKIIRDRFAPSKLMTRQDVVDKYQLVFKHDRAGRLIDAQEFRFLRFPRARFAPEVLEDLFDTCRSSVIEDGDDLIITHMYVERESPGRPCRCAYSRIEQSQGGARVRGQGVWPTPWSGHAVICSPCPLPLAPLQIRASNQQGYDMFGESPGRPCRCAYSRIEQSQSGARVRGQGVRPTPWSGHAVICSPCPLPLAPLQIRASNH
jgi:isocitrate dehydrogenase kinase/phosphatase